MVNFDTSELNTLAVDLGKAADSIGERAFLVLRKTAVDVEADAKMFAPVDTGNLKNSISSEPAFPQPGVVEMEIGPTANYGAFVEFGTSRMAPRAYMGPALDRRTPAFVAAMEKVAGEIL